MCHVVVLWKRGLKSGEVKFILILFENYGQCYEVLGALVKFRCKNACRDGGGPPFCKIRKCSQRRGIEGCWECDEFLGGTWYWYNKIK
ncbi:MAG TPA: hypothetical protein C5S37_14745 [Methanophagales archaeon]|nr:hypothetical protein [Methanophagales archaeon]